MGTGGNGWTGKPRKPPHSMADQDHPTRPGPAPGFPFLVLIELAGQGCRFNRHPACMSRPAAGPARPPGARQRLPQHRRKETGTATQQDRYSPANRSLPIHCPPPCGRVLPAAGRLWCPFARRLKGRMCEVSQPLRRSPTSLAVFAALKAGPIH